MAAQLPVRLPLDQMQQKWKSQLDPIIGIPMLQGLQLTGVALKTGVNVINHKLGQKQQGWFITDQDAAASLYRSAPLNNLTLTLTASAPCNVSIWVY